ncbi:uncharacterized protein LOC127741122 [Arachis duranensis]|uniref:Uncharacterized protein LOC127741122 n=1 Tax=Arachis duranensis TaxID=130453 RepID=A0A9C6T7R2_ARADU|nr:uncharacterized protein LOC127741122 [Arachis duranensis]
MEGPPMTFVFHHGGLFRTGEDGDMVYEPDNTEVLMGVEGDTLDVFFVRGYYKELGYIEAGNCWWKVPGVPIPSGLKKLENDADLIAMCKDCRRNQHLINLYFEDCISQPCVVDNRGEGVPLLEAGTSKEKKLSSQAKMHHSQPVKTPTINHPQPKKPTYEPTKAASQPSRPKAQPSKPNSQPMKPASQPSKPNKAFSQPTKPTHQASKTTSQPIRTPLQSTKLHPQQAKSNSQGKTVPHHSKTSSQPAKTPESNKKKGNSSACRVTRSGRIVREGPIQDEDSDSHDSYESTEDELYKPPKVVGDSLYSSESDSDSGKGSERKQKQAEAKEKHRPPKSRLADKEIDTDDSSYEGFEDEESSESDVDEDDDDLGSFSDPDSWHSEDSGKELESDEETLPVYPQYNAKTKFGNLKFEVSMTFKSKAEFIQATRDYTIQWGRNILFTKNDRVRVRAVCKSDDCPWVVYCACNSKDLSWQIKTLVDNHTCPRKRKNRAATQTWTLSKLVPKLRKHPTMKHREVYDWFVRKCNVYLNSTCITRALKAARKIVEGDKIAQYGLVWDYANELLTSNPGSRVQVGVIPMPESPPLFDRFYVCLDACKRGFKAGCRPLIGLDGAFLKTLHGGQILTACGQDANNHIFVIAYAIVNVENKDNWQWFLELLHSDLGDYREHKWCFISDMQKGLIPAVQEVFPRVHHRFCVWHLWRNFSKQWGSCELKDLVWECARSRTTSEFDRNMKRVKLINEKAWQYLDKWPKEAWTKAHFSEVLKVDNICNNACESFNAKIKHDRSKPILTLAEEVRRIIMKSMVDNRKKLQNYQGILPPVQQSRLEAMTVLSRHWAPQWSGDEKEELYEVHGWPTNIVVDLGKHTCTCRFWQLIGNNFLPLLN